MKLKFLSLFLALGMFVLGTNVSAQSHEGEMQAPASEHRAEGALPPAEPEGTPAEEQVVLKDTASNLLCKFLPANLQALPTCAKVCANDSTPTALQYGQCAVEIADASTTTFPWIPKVEGSIAMACNVGCNASFPTYTCKNPTVLKACGYICCNIPPAKSKVTNCLKSYGPAGQSTCAYYTETPRQ